MSNRSKSPVTQTLSDRTVAALTRDLEAAEVEAYAIEQLCWLLDYAHSHELSLKSLAKAVGISQGVISQMFNARYPGNYNLRARKIEAFRLDESKRALFGGRDDFVETELARSLFITFDRARFDRRIHRIESPEQLGKSRVGVEYARCNNGGRTLLVTLKPGMTSRPCGVFLRELALACGCHNFKSRKIIDLRFDIQEALSLCDLIIIDEFHQAESWPDREVRELLNFIRTDLHADGARGVVLIATNADVFAMLDSFRRRTRYNLGQLLGRMCNEKHVISPDDIPEADVRALIERYYHPGKRALAKLFDLTTRPHLGHFGLLLDILNRAWTECKLNNSAMTDQLVLDIARETIEDIDAIEKDLKLRKDPRP